MGIGNLFKKRVKSKFSSEFNEENTKRAVNFINNKPLFLNRNDPILDVIDLFVDNITDIVFVGSKNNIEGKIRKIDLINGVEEFSPEMFREKKINSIMNKKLNYCNYNDSLENICKMFFEKNISDLIVMSNSKVKGHIGYFEILYAISQFIFKIENPPILNSYFESKLNKIDYNVKIIDLCKMMQKNKGDYSIVFKKDMPIGIVTIKDLCGVLKKEIDLENIAVDNIMSPNIVSLNPGNSINDALKTMLERRFNQIPIIFEGKFVGVIDLKSLFNAHYKFILELKEDIKKNDFDEFVKEVWE